MTEVEIKSAKEILAATKVHCQEQLKNAHKNAAAILRTINTEYANKPAYEFEITNYGLNEPRYCFITKWNVDVLIEHNFLEQLYELQLSKKNSLNRAKSHIKNISGKILATSYEETVCEGASKIESTGFMDINDMPPIDTWFYRTYVNGARQLLSWVPKQFIENAQKAIDVNCVDVIQWLETIDPKLNAELIKTDANIR